MHLHTGRNFNLTTNDMNALYRFTLAFTLGITSILPSVYSWYKYKHTEPWYVIRSILYWSNIMLLATFTLTILNIHQVIPDTTMIGVVKSFTAYNMHITVGYFTLDRTWLDHHHSWQRYRMVFVHTVPLLTTYSMALDLQSRGFGTVTTEKCKYITIITLILINIVSETIYIYLSNKTRYTISSNIYSWVLIWLFITPISVLFILNNLF